MNQDTNTACRGAEVMKEILSSAEPTDYPEAFDGNARGSVVVKVCFCGVTYRGYDFRTECQVCDRMRRERDMTNVIMPDPTLAWGYIGPDKDSALEFSDYHVEAAVAISIPISASSIDLIGANGIQIAIIKPDLDPATQDAIAELKELLKKQRPGKLTFEFSRDVQDAELPEGAI